MSEHLPICCSPPNPVKVKVKSLSCVQLFATPWTVAYQASLSLGFSRQEYWSGLPFPSLGDLPDPGIEPGSPALQADAYPLSHQGSPQILKQLCRGKNWVTRAQLGVSPQKLPLIRSRKSLHQTKEAERPCQQSAI